MWRRDGSIANIDLIESTKINKPGIKDAGPYHIQTHISSYVVWYIQW